MSIEAIAFVKTLPVDNSTSRLLLFIIGENTFNDSCICKVGQQVLIDETLASESTVRRHLAQLVEKGVLKIEEHRHANGMRLPDSIELLGFREWLGATRCVQAVKMTGGSGVESSPQHNRSKRPVSTGHLLTGINRSTVTGTYKDNRTSKSVQESAQAREDSNSDLKVKRNSLTAITLTTRDSSWKAWIDHLRANGAPDVADAAELAERMIVSQRWPKFGADLPIVDKAPIAAKALADRMVGGDA